MCFGPKGGTQRNQNLWIPNVQLYIYIYVLRYYVSRR